VCVALKVLCVAPDAEALGALRRAAVSAEWELAPGATTERDAARQLREERVHVVVVFGPFERFVRKALRSQPSLRMVADRDLPGVSVVVGSLDEVRSAVLGVPGAGAALPP
jgi:hypothetical protein